MKHIIAFAALALCILLVLLAPFAIDAARQGVDIWWNTLLPVLFPFFASATLMEKSGALHRVAKLLYPLSKKLHISHYALPMLFFGGLSGYPCGARLCGMLQASNSISQDETERLATVCNLCSPMFLVGALSANMFHNAKLFLSFALGHYGGALLVALCMHLVFPIPIAKLPKTNTSKMEPFYHMLPRTISSCMSDMLKVGGSVIFFLVLAEVLSKTGVFSILGAPIDRLFLNTPGNSPAHGLLLGILEMTGGCHYIATAGLSNVIAVPLCSFLVSFGGLSVMVQALSFVEFKKPLKYILIKLFHGVVAALISYLIIASQTDAGEVFAPQTIPIATNAISGLATLFACTLGIMAAFILSLIAAKTKKIR